MARVYFDHLDAVVRFARCLDVQRHRLRCPNCQRSEALVLHDYLYRQVSSQRREIVAKRLFCSPRNGRGGCGATLRLQVADRVARLRYGAAALTAFVLALIAGLRIHAAYAQATGAGQSRNAYRWLRRLHLRLAHFRSFLGQRTTAAGAFADRADRLRLLLPTLQAVFHKAGAPPIVRYQVHCQAAFA